MAANWLGRYAAYLDWPIYICLMLVGLGACVSEPFTRNFVRLALVLAAFRVCSQPDLLQQLKPCRGFLLAMAALVAALCLSAWHSGHLRDMLSADVLRHSYNMLLLPLIFLFARKEKYLLGLLAMVGTSLLMMDIAIFQQAWEGEFRPISTMHGSFMLTAMFYVFLLPVLLVGLIHLKLSVGWRIVQGIVIILSLLGIVLTNTRGPWLAIIVCIVTIVFLSFRWQKILLSLVAGAVVVAVMLAAVPGFSERVNSIGDLKEQSQSERLLMYQSAWHMFNDHPLLGVGLGNYKQAYQQRYISPEAKELTQEHAHNNILQFLAENGLVGCGTFVILFGYCLAWSWRRRQNVFGLMAFAATLAFWLYISDYTFAGYGGMRVYYFLLGIGVTGAQLSLAERG